MDAITSSGFPVTERTGIDPRNLLVNHFYHGKDRIFWMTDQHSKMIIGIVRERPDPVSRRIKVYCPDADRQVDARLLWPGTEKLWITYPAVRYSRLVEEVMREVFVLSLEPEQISRKRYELFSYSSSFNIEQIFSQWIPRIEEDNYEDIRPMIKKIREEVPPYLWARLFKAVRETRNTAHMRKQARCPDPDQWITDVERIALVVGAYEPDSHRFVLETFGSLRCDAAGRYLTSPTLYVEAAEPAHQDAPPCPWRSKVPGFRAHRLRTTTDHPHRRNLRKWWKGAWMIFGWTEEVA